MKKMVKCKFCGNEIARTAKTCPHCGAKKKKHLLLITLLIVFFVIVMIAVLGSSSETEPMDEPVQKNSEEVNVEADSNEEKEEIIEIKAKDLWGAYEENKVSADKAYKNKVLAVTGTISDITQDVLTKNPCVVLETGNIVCPVQCFFDGSEESADAVSQLADGQEITIVGTCDGTPIMQVQLNDCYIK